MRGHDDDYLLLHDCMAVIVVAICVLSDCCLQCITAWFYPGQPEVHYMLACTSVQSSFMEHNLTAHNPMFPTYGSRNNLTQPRTPQRAMVNPQEKQILNKRLERLLEIYRMENKNP